MVLPIIFGIAVGIAEFYLLRLLTNALKDAKASKLIFIMIGKTILLVAALTVGFLFWKNDIWVLAISMVVALILLSAVNYFHFQRVERKDK